MRGSDGVTPLDIIEEMEVLTYCPNIKRIGFNKTSNRDRFYNCFAHAIGDSRTWWEPVTMYWPSGFRTDGSLASYIDVCVQHLKFEPCDTTDFGFDLNFQKIALYADENNDFTHAMRQLDAIYWTSKIGEYIDVRHTVSGMIGCKYGGLASHSSTTIPLIKIGMLSLNNQFSTRTKTSALHIYRPA